MPDLRAVATLVRWTTTEIATVRDRAAACGLTTARYVRECALGAVPKATRHADTQALLRELARSGNNLNQLAHEAHARDLFPVEEKVDAVLARHMALILQLADETRA
jgi:Mobilization protein NikA